MPTEVNPSFPPYNGCTRKILIVLASPISFQQFGPSFHVYTLTSRQHQQKLLTNWLNPCTLPYQMIYPLTACLITVLVARHLMKAKNRFSLRSAQTPQCASHIYLHSLQGNIKVAVERILSSFSIASSGWHKGIVLFVNLFSPRILSILKKLGYHCYHIPKSRSYAYAALQSLSLCQL